MASRRQRVEIVAANLDFERRREAEQLRACEFHFGIRAIGHAGAQAIDFVRFDFLAAAVGERDRQARDVLARFGRIRIETRAGTGDAVDRFDAGILGVPRGDFADELVGFSERRAGRQRDRHVETALRELRNQIEAERRHQRHAEREHERGEAEHAPRMLERLGQRAVIERGGAIVRTGDHAADKAQAAPDVFADEARRDRDDPRRRTRQDLEEHLADRAEHARGSAQQAALRQRARRRDGLVAIRERCAAAQRCEHRDQRHRDNERDQHRERDRQRLVAEQLSGNALHEHEREEHRDRRQRRCRHGHADFGRAAYRGFDDRRALFAQARDVLEHDDRIVDDHAGREREAAERHHVEREMQLTHEEERRDQRHRQRERDDERAPRVAEEEEDDQDREHAAEQRVELHFAERVLDEDRLILDRRKLRAFRQRILELFDLCVDGLGDADRIGVAFLVDRELDRLAAVDAHDAFAFLVALRDGRDVLEAHRHVAVDLDQELAHLVEILELVDRAHEKALAAFVDAAAGGVDVLVLETRDDFVDVDAEARQLLLVDRHVDLVLEAAADLDRGDARDGLDALLQIIVGEAAQLLQLDFARGDGRARRRCFRVLGRRGVSRCRCATVGGQTEPQDRIGRRIEAQQQRLLRFERQLQRVELVAHLEAGHVHVGAPGELEHDIGLAGARYRMHLAHVLDDADGLFDRLADQVFDFQRRGTFVFGAHRQRRVRQIRQQVDLESGESDQAEQHHRQRQHADGDAPARGQLRQTHDPDSGAFARTCAACACAGGGVSTVTSVPSRTALRPIVMTRSPSLRPSRTSTRSLSE